MGTKRHFDGCVARADLNVVATFRWSVERKGTLMLTKPRKEHITNKERRNKERKAWMTAEN